MSTCRKRKSTKQLNANSEKMRSPQKYSFIVQRCDPLICAALNARSVHLHLQPLIGVRVEGGLALALATRDDHRASLVEVCMPLAAFSSCVPPSVCRPSIANRRALQLPEVQEAIC